MRFKEAQPLSVKINELCDGNALAVPDNSDNAKPPPDIHATIMCKVKMQASSPATPIRVFNCRIIDGSNCYAGIPYTVLTDLKR